MTKSLIQTLRVENGELYADLTDGRVVPITKSGQGVQALIRLISPRPSAASLRPLDDCETCKGLGSITTGQGLLAAKQQCPVCHGHKKKPRVFDMAPSDQRAIGHCIPTLHDDITRDCACMTSAQKRHLRRNEEIDISDLGI